MLTTTSGFRGFSVNDLPAALAFYRDTLGLDARDSGMGIELNVGADARLHLSQGRPPAGHVHCLQLRGRRHRRGGRRARRRRRHARAVRGMNQDEKGIARGKAANMGPDIAWFTDPAGNILSVLNG